MFGINGGEFLVILVVAVLVIGPERLPKYAEQLAQLVRQARVMLAEAKEKVSEELGPEVTDVDWAQLDPRRYDPRRIVRDALLDDTPLDPRRKAAGAKAAAGAAAATGVAATGAAATAAAAAPAQAHAGGTPEGDVPVAAWPEPQPALASGESAPFDVEAT